MMVRCEKVIGKGCGRIKAGYISHPWIEGKNEGFLEEVMPKVEIGQAGR